MIIEKLPTKPTLLLHEQTYQESPESPMIYRPNKVPRIYTKNNLISSHTGGSAPPPQKL